MSKQLSTGSFNMEGIMLGAMLGNQKDTEGIPWAFIYLFIYLLLQVASCESFISSFKLPEKTD